MTDLDRAVRVITVVNWREQSVQGATCDEAEARQWVREIVARYGDPTAASMTVSMVEPPSDERTSVDHL